MLTFAAVALSSGMLAGCGGGGAATSTDAAHVASSAGADVSDFPVVPGSRTITLQAPTSYKPKAPPGGGTDDYHCTLVNPHVATNSYIVADHFFPNSPEVHHAILFLVPPSMAAAARAADDNGKGWTCFGETTLPGQDLADLGATPWLAAWAPGHGLDQEPAGTGVAFPAGSLVIMQVHYNMLVGDAPVHVKLMLQVVPITNKLIPLHLDLLPAPPDIPCPSGVTGPLCNRAASLANLGQRFGASMIAFVDVLEEICGRNPDNPPAGDTTSCTWPLYWNGYILRLTAHMHLLGVGMKIVLNPGTPGAKTLLDVTNYDFNYQRSYNIKPVAITSGDKLQVTCTYNPRLRQELPQLRKLPARFVTWGDGSSDEMCLGIVGWTSSLPS
jgi:hypothetical protein